MVTEATYPLIPDAAPSPGAAVSITGKAPAGFPDFIGFGLLTPFRRGPADFVSGGGVAFLQSAIGQVLGVRSGSDFTEGELPWRSDFGSLLHLIRHQNNDAIRAEIARVYVGEALAKWVPQVRVKQVETSRKVGAEGEENILVLRLVYDIIGTNRPGNEVLVPGVKQVVTLSAAA